MSDIPMSMMRASITIAMVQDVFATSLQLGYTREAGLIIDSYEERNLIDA
jgi:hypothetical protein